MIETATQPRPKVRLSTPMMLAAALVALAALAAVLWGLKSNYPVGVAEPKGLLSLRAEHVGNDLLISWDRGAAAKLQARRAFMTISDGEAHQQIALDSTELETGRILYAPRSGNTSVRLDLHLAGKTVSETLRILGASPVTAVSAPPPSEMAASADPAPAEPKAEPPATPPQVPERAIEPLRRPVPHSPFQPPAPRPRSREPRLEEPPQVASQSDLSRHAPVHFPMVDPPGPALAPDGSKSSPAPLVIAVRPPIPARRVQPELSQARPFLRLLTKPVVVEVEVEVDAAGAVSAAKLNRVSADLGASRSALQQHLVVAALSAARNWAFEPATRNGTPIPSRSLIVFRFSPSSAR